jgi:DNA invertase Pin-like site-specific DNA recombinase
MANRVNCKLVAYRRVSTQKQSRSGLGLEAQDTAIRLYAAQTGCKVIGEFTDVETGKRSDRPELAKAINCAKRNKAVLVIAKLDRISRKVYFISGLMESGVDFFAADCPNDDITMTHFRAVIAEDEARKISQRTKAALAVAKARGVKLGTPENLTEAARVKGADENRNQAVTAYALITPLIEKLRTEGLSMKAIADRLNDGGHVTRTGSPWSAMQIKRVLDRGTHRAE